MARHRIVSVRLTEAEYETLKKRAEGKKISDLIRSGVAGDWLDDASDVEVMRRFMSLPEATVAAPVGYRCQHMSMTAGGGRLTDVQAWCGCKMTPVFP